MCVCDVNTKEVRGRDLAGGVNVAPEGLGDAIAAKRASRGFESAEEMTGKMVLPLEEPPAPAVPVPDSHTDPERETYERFHGEKPSHGITRPISPKMNQLFPLDTKSGNAAHTREIDQGLQSTIQSAITDIEKDLDEGEFQEVAPLINGDGEENKENQGELPHVNGDAQNGTNGYHHEEDQVGPMVQLNNPVRLRLPHEFKGKVRPMSMPAEMTNFEPMGLPEVGMNGPRKVMQPHVADNTDGPGVQAPFKPQMQMVQTKSQSSTSMSYSKTSSSTMVIDAGPDTGSLKRRNPKQMFTDSAFYSPQHHPSVQEQVEMAHKLSSSLYDEGNRTSVGQEMFMKRAKKSGDGFTTYEDEEPPRHDKVPNLKLVMNPDGKLHDWTDLPEEELPEMQILAQGGASPDTAHHVVENLEACKGRGGELFAKRKEKAEKWVIDENTLGREDPRRHADKYVQQQTMHQEQIMKEKEMDMQRKMQEQQRMKEESYQRQREEERERNQLIQAQTMEQQQQMAMRHQKTRQAIQKQQGGVIRSQAQEGTPAWVKQPQQLQNPGMYGGHSAFKEPRDNFHPTAVDGGPFHHKNQHQSQQYGSQAQQSQQQFQQFESHQSQSFQQTQQFDQFQQQQLQQHAQSYQSMPQPESYRAPAQIQPSFSSSLPPPMAMREVELPASVKPCSLKGHLFTPKFDDSIHNAQGINVWTAKMPKPWGSKSSTLPRSSRINETYSGSRKSSIEVSRSVPRESEMPSLESMQPKETRYPSELKVNNFHQPQQSQPTFQQTTKPKSPPRHESQPPMAFENQLEAEKYREYEEWMKAQAKEQETLEYDCSVKYVEKQAPNEKPQMLEQRPTMVESFQAQQSSQYRYSEERSFQVQQQTLQQTIQKSPSLDRPQQPQEQPSFDQDQNRAAAEEMQRRQQEAADQARMEQEAVERQRQEQEAAERQQQEQEAAERQRQEQEAAERQRQEQEAAERQRQEQEATERQRQEQEAAERQRQEQEAAERQRQEQEAAERQRHEQEAAERQRQEQEAAERQRQEQEAVERQRQEQEHAEQLRMQEQEAAERQRQEQEHAEQLRMQQQAAEQRAAQEEYQRQQAAAEEARFQQEQEKQRSQHEQQVRQQEEQARQQQEQMRQQEQFHMQQEKQMQWQKQQEQQLQQQQQTQLAQPMWQPPSQDGNYSLQSSSMSQSQSYSFQSQSQSQVQTQQTFGHSPGQQPVQFQNYHHSESQQKQSSSFQVSSSMEGADYSTSLRPTTTGALIRTQGDIHFTTAPSKQGQWDDSDNSTFSSLRKTEFGDQLRQTGSIGRPRLYGEEDQDVSPFSSLKATEFGNQLRVKGDIEKSPSGLQQNYDMESQQRHSVKNLVEHFKQAAPPPDMISRPVKRQEMIVPQVQPLQPKPQFTQPQQQQEQPQASAQSMQMSDQQAFQQSQSSLSNSHIADYCTIDGSFGGQGGINGGIQDPSAILGVNEEYVESQSRRRIGDHPNQPEHHLTDAEVEKWDNHNAIARGWRNVDDTYRPVTFRKLYGIKGSPQLNRKSAMY
ncbi:trichohyalin-like isoform X3 [Tigriopus californicus]|uniref:trichohyalin-like isoform X3 n=1 Tax=Tigriopus californicus TaxID=6832 RepID=UPI0027DAA9BA|nr:trichohyalin-like isoform X3 [Tigriopus californicus]